jgi:hypothetical protein
LYDNYLACHLLISQFFWLVFLLFSLDRIVVKLHWRFPSVALPYALLLIAVAVDNWRHPDKGGVPIMNEIPQFLETVYHYEQLDLASSNQFLVIKTQGFQPGYFEPCVRVGSHNKNAVQIGSHDLVQPYGNAFITEP